jgi:hypothetical protein
MSTGLAGKAVADEDRMRGMRPCALVRRCRTETFVGRRSLFEGLARSMGNRPPIQETWEP